MDRAFPFSLLRSENSRPVRTTCMSAPGIQSLLQDGDFSSESHRIAHSDLPIFNQDWWIDIARSSPDFRELKVSHAHKVVGRLPFVLSRNRMGLTRGCDPHWSHLGGPIVDQRLSRSEQAGVIRSLLAQLPRWVSYCFICDSNLSYADLVRKAFRDAGFRHSTQITYIRHPEEGDVLGSRKAKHRGHIKRAAKSLECVDINATEFVQFFKMNLKARGKRSYAPLDAMSRLIEKTLARQCARAIAVKPRSCDALDARRSPYDAAIVYVWDNTRCYYWLSSLRASSKENQGSNPHPDAIKLLAFEAMEHARAMNLTFDADGVATPGAENLYRNMFGLRTEQHRDVFQRENMLERFYQQYRQKFRTMVAGSPVQQVLNLNVGLRLSSRNQE